jgi:hypothetical protein
LFNLYATKTWGSGGVTASFFTFALNRDGQSASCLRCFTPGLGVNQKQSECCIEEKNLILAVNKTLVTQPEACHELS